MRVIGVAVLAGVAGGLLTGCGGAGAGGEGTLQAHGDVKVVDARGAVVQTSHLRPGDRVRVGDGVAVVSLPNGGRLELRNGSAVTFNGGPQLDAGDLLAEARRDAPVRVATTIATITVVGAARLHRDLALEVGTYRGTATVGAGRTVQVGALSEDGIPAVGVVPDPVPLQLSAKDLWDQRFLGSAIELTAQLDAESRYVTANSAAAEARQVAFYQRTFGGRAATVSAQLLDASPTPGDALVAAAIAAASAGPFVTRWTDIQRLRQEDAAWGIVVLDEQATPTQVIDFVNAALDGAAQPAATALPTETAAPPVSSAPASAAPAITSAPAPTTTTPTTRAPAAAGAGKTAPTTTTTLLPGVTVPTVPGSSPTSPTTLPLAPVLNPVVGLIHSLLPGSS